MEPSNTPPKLHLVNEAPASSSPAAELPAAMRRRAGRHMAHATDSAKTLAAMLAGAGAAALVLDLLRALGVVP